MRVVIAVADAAVRELLVEALDRRGHDVVAETSGAAAEIAVTQQDTRLIVLGQRLPDGDGLAWCRRIKSRGDFHFVLILVDGASNAELNDVLSAGANDYLVHPLDLGLLDVRLAIAERQVAEIAERRRVEEALRIQALYDALTALPNRTLLLDRLQHAIVLARRTNEPFALFVMDLDRFKEVNDTLGHHAGDVLLQQVGTRLQRLVGDSDTVARLGGDEFAVLLPGTYQHGAALTARRIVRTLEQPFVVEGISLEVGASIGITLYPDHGADADALIQRADVAMYVAKETGNGHAFYTSERDEHSSNRLALMGELRGAVEQRQLVLYYQPQVDLRSGEVAGCEALIRWQHPSRGSIPPDLFIPAAERTGLMRLISQFVLETAVKQCGEWHEGGRPLTVAVNLSARNLHDPQLPDRVAATLNAWNLPPAALDLEITESAVMVDPGHALEVLTRLRALGVQLSIDDFGTGYSSFGYLKRLPVSKIKIDKSFVLDMVVNENDAAIVRSIINLGHDLGLRVLAEGVETREAWDLLMALGCDEAQGYLLSRPVPALEFMAWLADSHRAIGALVSANQRLV